jgi:cell pole-organizing protein PopZ
MKPETALRDWHSELRSGNCDCSLGNLVRELLHPLLKEWLDRNLAEIVEKCVNDEIKRMARN